MAQAPVPVRSSHLTSVPAGREQREDRDTPSVHPHLGVAHLAEQLDAAPAGAAVPVQSMMRPPRPTRRRSSSSMFAPSGTSSLRVASRSRRFDLRGADRGHDDAARGAHVEAAGRRPGAEKLDDATVGPDLDGVGFGADGMLLRSGWSAAPVWRPRACRDGEDGGRPDERAGDVVRRHVAELGL